MKESFVPLPLPSYDMFRLVKENPWVFTIISTLLAVFISAFIWKHFRLRQKTGERSCAGQSRKALEQGCFNSKALKGIRRHVFADEEISNYSNGNSLGNMDAYLDYENLGPLYPKSKKKRKPSPNEEGSSCTSSCNLNGGIEDDEGASTSLSSKNSSVSDELVKSVGVMESLKMLHGKLATADMNLKARHLEQSMTEEEKKEEALVRKKQLESIFALMAQNKERFGVYDESEIMDQMKLYSFSK